MGVYRLYQIAAEQGFYFNLHLSPSEIPPVTSPSMSLVRVWHVFRTDYPYAGVSLLEQQYTCSYKCFVSALPWEVGRIVCG